MSFNWTCPHCYFPQIGGEENHASRNTSLPVGKNALGPNPGAQIIATACQNKACNKVTLSLQLFGNGLWKSGGWVVSGPLQRWQLLPDSFAKPQPDYIPLPLREDYLEACKIRDLSPKASAALARRCLQGMIRDFCFISRPTLKAEIEALDGLVKEGKEPRGVTPESVQAIDNVRGIGNIGAHMEKDINLIVEIDPGEAQVLIELIETLFDEWYVARQTRNERFSRLATIAAEKAAARKGDPPS